MLLAIFLFWLSRASPVGCRNDLYFDGNAPGKKMAMISPPSLATSLTRRWQRPPIFSRHTSDMLHGNPH